MITEVIMIADNPNLPLYVISTIDDGYLILDEQQLDTILYSHHDIISFADLNLTINRARFIALTSFS